MLMVIVVLIKEWVWIIWEDTGRGRSNAALKRLFMPPGLASSLERLAV
jgi:hypothetical protein